MAATSLGTTILPHAVGLKREVASLVGGFDLATGAFAFNTIRRERGPRGEIVIGHCVRYLGISENLTAVLTTQSPGRHRLKSCSDSTSGGEPTDIGVSVYFDAMAYISLPLSSHSVLKRAESSNGLFQMDISQLRSPSRCTTRL